MKTILNIIIALLIIANSVFAVGLYNYVATGETETFHIIEKIVDK